MAKPPWQDPPVWISQYYDSEESCAALWHRLTLDTKTGICAHREQGRRIGDIAAIHEVCKRYRIKPLPVLAFFGWRKTIDFVGIFMRPVGGGHSGTPWPIGECDVEIHAAWELYLRLRIGDA